MAATIAASTAVAADETIGQSTADSIWRQRVHDALLGVLDGDGDEAVRFHALRCLGALDTPQCIDALALALEDADEDLRAVAAEALANQHGDRVEGLLLRTLREDPAPDCKLAAIAGLSHLGERATLSGDTVSVLIELCSARGQSVCWDDIANDGWDDWLDVQIAAIRALARIRPDDALSAAIDGITRALDDEDSQELAGVACAAFAQLGAPGCVALQRCIGAPRERLRREAVAAMLHAPNAEHVTCLESLLKEGGADIRAAAFEALIALGQGDAHIATMLADKTPSVIIVALAHCTSVHGLNVFLKAVPALSRHNNEKVREAAARAMTRVAQSASGDMRTALVKTLPTLLSDPKPEVSAAAAEAAAALLGSGALKLLAQTLGEATNAASVRVAATSALERIPDPRAVAALIPTLSDEDWQVRRAALAAISRRAARGDDDALRALCECLEPGDAGTVTDNVDEGVAPTPLAAIPVTVEKSAPDEEPQSPALSTFDEILAANELVTDNVPLVLENDDAQRLAAANIKPRRRKHVSLEPDTTASLDAARFIARSLGECASPIAQSALEHALTSRDEEVRNAALSSLQRIGEQNASPELCDTLDALAHEGGIDNQVLATILLMQFDDPRGEARCRELLHGQDLPGCRALLQLIAQSPLPVDRALEDDVVALFSIEPLRTSALRAIAVINPTRVTEHLLPLIGVGDEGVHQAIGAMLSSQQLAPQAAARALLAGLEDPKWMRERVWVLEMLQRLL